MANFSLLAKLGLNSKGFQTGIDRAKSSVSKFGRSITKISNRLAKMGLAAASAAFVLLSRSALQSANAVGRAADRLGVTTDEFQDFTNAAKAADIQTRAAEMGLQRFTRRLGEAQQGGGELKDTLEKYNIAIRNSDGSARSATAVLGDLANAIQGAESPAEQLRIAFKAFDSEGADLVRILKDGEEGFKNFTKTGNEEFGKFEAGTIAALSRADKAIRAFKSRATIKVGELIAGEGDGAAVKVLTAQLMGAVAKFSVGLLEVLMKMGGTIPTFIGGALEGVANKFGISLKASAVKLKIALQEGVNTVIMKFNELTSANIQTLKVSYRELGDVQKEAAENTGSILETATKNVLKLWNDEPLKGWKDDIDAGTKALTSAYKGDLEAARKTAKIREKGAKESGKGIDENKPGDTGGDNGTGTGSDKTPEDTRGDMARELTGAELKKAANRAGKDDNIRFDRMADGSFQQFVDGKKGEKFTEEQMQKGLENKIEKDPTDKTLKSIEKILQGKLVNE